MRLFTNSNKKLDFVGKRLENICKDTNLYISVAFFSNSEFIINAINNGCSTIDLIVRLDYGTDPTELKKIINTPNVNIRYFSSKRFHPKMYIVDGKCAIIGSSNLTHSGLGKNLEINIEIENENPLYDELKFEFSTEWNDAAVLTDDILEKFKGICDEYGSKISDIARLTASKIGEVAPNNIQILGKKENSLIYMENFRKEYQQYLNAFKRLRNMYTSVSVERKYNENTPLHIEIDGLLSWLWDFYCDHDNYASPIMSDENIQTKIRNYKKEFVEYNGDNAYYLNLPQIHIIPEFNSKENIENLNIDKICKCLERVWAFHDRLRFFTGGLNTMIEEFKTKNESRIKETILYLLYGKEDYVVRIYNTLYSKKYKLALFGDSCVKELYGLVNKDNIPICNGRTRKVMNWLGFGSL